MADWMLNRRVLPWLVTLGAFLMWEGVVRTFQIQAFILPAPSLVSPPSVGGTSAWAAAPAPSAAASVRVTGLPTEWTAGDVKEHFGSCGKIISVSDLRGGVGTISFDSEAEAAKAAQDMDGVKLRANKLSVMATAQANRAKPY